MAVVEVTEVVAAAADETAVAVLASKKLAKEKAARAPKAAKEKKLKGSRSSVPAHPPYFQMIKEAILALNEKTGSSPHAIAKFIEEKHKGVLPVNFKKVLFVQLKNFTSKGKLSKVKASFKLSDTGKKDEKKKVAKKPEREAKKPRETRKRKVSSEPAAKKAPKASSKPKKAPVKKVKSLAVSTKPKQPKSIKSPPAKRTRKAAA